MVCWLIGKRRSMTLLSSVEFAPQFRMVSLTVSLLVGSHGKLGGAVLVEAEPLRCPCLLTFHRRVHGLPMWHRLRYNGNTSTRGNDQSRACDKSNTLEKES